MPVPHDLYQDLHRSPEDIQQQRALDTELDQLLKQYAAVDKRILAVESSGAVSDDELRTLKEQRLLVKDKIERQLQSST